MLTEPLIQQLHALHLKGMAHALQEQRASPDLTDRSFEDRLGLMIHQEMIERSGYRLAQRLRWAKLPMPACVEDLDTRAPRGLDPAQLAQVIDLAPRGLTGGNLLLLEGTLLIAGGERLWALNAE